MSRFTRREDTLLGHGGTFVTGRWSNRSNGVQYLIDTIPDAEREETLQERGRAPSSFVDVNDLPAGFEGGSLTGQQAARLFRG